MKLSKTFLFITALCCATPTLAIQNSTSSSGEQKMAMENTQTFEKFILLVAVSGVWKHIWSAFTG